jgi:hypothetical protein
MRIAYFEYVVDLTEHHDFNVIHTHGYREFLEH